MCCRAPPPFWRTSVPDAGTRYARMGIRGAPFARALPGDRLRSACLRPCIRRCSPPRDAMASTLRRWALYREARYSSSSSTRASAATLVSFPIGVVSNITSKSSGWFSVTQDLNSPLAN